MAGRRDSDPNETQSRRRPATTPEGRENQLIALAIDRAEQQLRDGTASAQVITHFLKLASTREQLEQERLRNENLLLQAKTESLANAGDMKELYENAIAAMRSYRTDQEFGDEGEHR